MKVILSALSEIHPLALANTSAELIELFQVAKELRFDGVDYTATIADLFYLSQRANALSDQYKVPILGVHAPLHLLFYTPAFLFNRLMEIQTAFPTIQTYNFHLSGFIHPLSGNDKSLMRFLQRAAQENVTITFESNPKLVGLGYYPLSTYDPDTFAKYCIRHSLPMTLDTAHIAHCNYDIVEFFKKYHQHIALIHLSDANGPIQHLPLGKGVLPIQAFLKELKRKSYSKMLAFEICNFEKRATQAEKIEDIRKSLQMVRTYAL